MQLSVSVSIRKDVFCLSRIVKRYSGKCLAFLLMLALVVSFVMPAVPASAKTLAEKFEGSTEGNTDVSYDRAEAAENTYKHYLEDALGKGYKNYTGSSIVLKAKDAICLDETADSTEENKQYKELPLVNDADSLNTEAIYWTSDYSGFRWVFKVEKSGFYTISMNYLGSGNLGVGATREFAINGKVPFSEAGEVMFKKHFVDGTNPVRNMVGDYVAASLVEVRKWATAPFRDRAGYYAESFRVYLEAGQNELSMYYGDQDMYIGDIVLSAPEEKVSYAEYIAPYSSLDRSGTAMVDYFQAEDRDRIVEKSSNTMRVTNNKQSTVENIVREVNPDGTVTFHSNQFETSSGAYTMMNQIGGETNWYQERDAYTWSFTVPKTGLYKISLRVSNGFSVGMPVYRQIYVDGTVPFEELLTYRFRYANNYYTETLSDADGNAFLFYLEEGTHELKMETIMGALGELALAFREETMTINSLARQIRKIVSNNPDPNYDYRLEKRIPELVPTMEALIKSFEDKIALLQAACETESSTAINNLRSSIDTLQSFINDTFGLATRVSEMTEIQTNMGTWVSEFESSPLEMDFIQIYEPSAEVENKKTSFWKGIANTWDCFITSFSKDYNATSEVLGESGKEVVEVWINRDREYADLIKAMLDEAFVDADFAINLRIVPGQIDVGSFNLLLLSMMAGRQPDMTWACSATTPVNFAIRGVGYNLEQFDDFQEVRSRFVDGAMVSFEYSDNAGRSGTFGLPETMGFTAMFYRKDIFTELGLNVPKTWDEIYEVIIPTFYRENYKMVPGDGGTFLLQKNGYSYRADNRIYGWDTDLAYDVFVENVEQYLVYGIDIANETTQGFRDGTYPIVFSDFNFYMTLKVAAPELLGKWSIAKMPGHVDELGVINRTITGGVNNGTGMMIISTADQPAQHADECWEIMKWWTGTDAQTEFEYIIDAYFGQANRWASANKEAFLALPWTAEEREVISDQFDWYLNIPVVLGDYQSNRYSSFAFNQVVIQGMNARDSIESMVEYINTELRRKQIEYGITPATQEEIDNKEYDVRASDKLSAYKALREQALRDQQNAAQNPPQPEAPPEDTPPDSSVDEADDENDENVEDPGDESDPGESDSEES